MFAVLDSRAKRRRYVISQAESDAELGVLLAAVDFEWTCRRCILFASDKPTVELKESFANKYASFGGLADGWNTEVANRINGMPSLMGVFDSWGPSAKISLPRISWSQICDAMQCRNVLIHGSEPSLKRTASRMSVYILESACDILESVLKEFLPNADIHKRIVRRRKNGCDKLSGSVKSITRLSNTGAKLGKNHWVNRKSGW